MAGYPMSCSRCAGALAPDALACGSCHTLVHAARLEELAVSARLHEQRHEPVQARDVWLSALELLPPDSAQAEWIRGNTKRLEALATSAPPADARHAWAKKLGPLAPIAILLANGKFLVALFKLKFLFSLAAFVAFYWALFGLKFGIGFAILILVHEMGHFIDIKRRGLPADMPVFLPGFGAYVRWQALGVPLETRAAISLAGPLAGCIGAGVCALLWAQTGQAFWMGLAGLTAMLNVMNLIPVWILDGGQATNALDRNGRWILLAAAVLCAVVFQESVFLLVAVGFIWRLFTRDLPPVASQITVAYF